MNVGGNFGAPIPMSASGIVKASQGVLFGFLCTVTGTLDLYDSPTGATGTHFLAGLPVVAGTYYPIPVGLATGLYAAMTSCAGTFICV